MTWRSLTRESAAATQADIEDLIGITRQTFRASAFLAQGDGANFTAAAPRQRKSVLAEVLGLEVWEGLLEKARHERREMDMRMVSIGGFVDRSQQELAAQHGLTLELSDAREREQAAQSSLAEATARLATAREALVEARGRVERRAGAEKAAQRAGHALADLVNGLVEREEALKVLDERLATRAGLAGVVGSLPDLEEEREDLRQAIAAWDERERLENELKQVHERNAAAFHRSQDLLRRAFEAEEPEDLPECDRCGRTLDSDAAARAAASYRAEATALEPELDATHDRVFEITERLNALPLERPDRERWNAIAAEISDVLTAQMQLAALDEAQTRRDELNEEIEKMRAELPVRELEVEASRAELDALGPHDDFEERQAQSKVNDIELTEATRRQSLTKWTQDIARLEERLARLDALAGEVHLATRERDTLHEELELLSALERAYGPNGIPAYIVENTAIPSIEAEACRLLRDLGTEYQVELHTQRETKTGGVTDALAIVVYDGIRARPYEGFSGGEKTRIELALRIALAHLLANRRGAESRVLVIDEPDGLDSAGMAALADVLRHLHADGVFEKILLVSHVAELRDAFEASIHVVCENGVSRVDGAREMVIA